jgi:multisubunit Na+/H+ antiporter MnhB subunit
MVNGGNVSRVRSSSGSTARVSLWVVAALLLLAAGWSFNLATYNWFAADFQNQYSHAYASRGNIFSIIAIVLFATSISMIVALLRSSKKRRAKA